MSKEYLKAFGRITLHTEYDNDGSYDCLQFEDDCKLVDEALERLESIDNANPSEALECLEEMWELSCDSRKPEYTLYETIKQALLKTQEPKHYLKWEDLEPFEEDKEILGLLNGNKYILHTYRDSKHKYVLISLNSINMATLCDLFKQDIDFFNDLRLERVEE